MQKFKTLSAAAAGILVPSLAFATQSTPTVDFSPITNAFTATDIVAAIMAIGATLATIYVANKGLSFVLQKLRGG